jgi:transformation/transcription domain-associated protein
VCLAAGQLRVHDMMQAVREYLHADSQMAYHLWVLMFPIVWATLEKQQQAALAKPIIALLSKEYHQKQTAARPNIVQVGVGLWCVNCVIRMPACSTMYLCCQLVDCL